MKDYTAPISLEEAIESLKKAIQTQSAVPNEMVIPGGEPGVLFLMAMGLSEERARAMIDGADADIIPYDETFATSSERETRDT